MKKNELKKGKKRKKLDRFRGKKLKRGNKHRGKFLWWCLPPPPPFVEQGLRPVRRNFIRRGNNLPQKWGGGNMIEMHKIYPCLKMHLFTS